MTSDPLTILLRHNAWATGVLLDMADQLEPARLTQPFEIGLGSIRATLAHIVGCMERWSDRVALRKLRPLIDDGQPITIDQLREHLLAATDDLRQIIDAHASAGTMDERLTLTGPDGQKATLTRAACITHCLVHGTHHRAQVLNMLRRLGVSQLPDLDVIDWQEQTEKP